MGIPIYHRQLEMVVQGVVVLVLDKQGLVTLHSVVRHKETMAALEAQVALIMVVVVVVARVL